MHTTKLCGEKEFDSFDSSVGGFTAELLQSSLQIQQCAENVWRFCEYCNNGIHIRSPGGSMPFVCIKMVLEDTHFCFGKSPKIFNELSQNKLTTKCDQGRIVLNLLRFCVSVIHQFIVWLLSLLYYNPKTTIEYAPAFHRFHFS